MKKQKEPRAFDDVQDLIDKAIKGQRGFVCEGDAVERRATEFYCVKLRATKRILRIIGKLKTGKSKPGSVESWLGNYWINFDDPNGVYDELAKAMISYQRILDSREKAELRRAAFEMGDGLIAQGLARIPALNAGTASLKVSRREARKLGLRIKP
jgi:hypothetical protein